MDGFFGINWFRLESRLSLLDKTFRNFEQDEFESGLWNDICFNEIK